MVNANLIYKQGVTCLVRLALFKDHRLQLPRIKRMNRSSFNAAEGHVHSRPLLGWNVPRKFGERRGLGKLPRRVEQTQPGQGLRANRLRSVNPERERVSIKVIITIS